MYIYICYTSILYVLTVCYQSPLGTGGFGVINLFIMLY